MKQNYRDAMTHLGLAISTMALREIGTFTGWMDSIILGASSILILAALVELFAPNLLNK